MTRPIAIVLLIGWLAGCSAPSADTGDVDSSGVVRRGTFQDRLLLTGELAAVSSERIMVPQTPARQVAIRWFERDGAEVRAGQRVVELDNTQFAGQLEDNRLNAIRAENDLLARKAEVAGEIEEAEYQVEATRIALEKAKIDAAVPAELLPLRDFQEAQLAMSRAQTAHDKAALDLETARRAADAGLEERRIALRRAREEIVRAEEAIAALTLTAPRDGLFVVAASRMDDSGRKLAVGDSVWVGMEVGRIPDLGEMKVAGLLSDVDDGRVQPGMAARCTIDSYPESSYAGRVVSVSPIAQENGGTDRRFFGVEVMLDESDPEKMRPGMSVLVEILPDPLEDVLIAPRSAIEFRDDEVGLRRGGGRLDEITLGPCNAVECVVTEGASEGDRLGGRG